jgi:hypothetical protein
MPYFDNSNENEVVAGSPAPLPRRAIPPLHRQFLLKKAACQQSLRERTEMVWKREHFSWLWRSYAIETSDLKEHCKLSL